MRRGEDLKRRRARLDVRPRFLIVCEGRVTEPEYINLIRINEKINLVRVIIDNQGGTPKTLVDRAVAEKRQNKSEFGKEDEIWCVFDIDEHPLIAEAKQKASSNGIKLAISNPCFEFWLLLHFVYHSAPISRQEARRECEARMNGYQKHIPGDALFPLLGTALENAQRLAKWHETRQTVGENPSTEVYKLIERLRASSKQELIKKIARPK
jgi:hypothetical protein